MLFSILLGTGPMVIHFNAFPEETRRRLIDCLNGRDSAAAEASDVDTLMSVVGASVVVAAFCALVGFGAWNFGTAPLFEPDPPAWTGYLDALLVGGSAFGAAWGALNAVRFLVLRSMLPFPPGRYLFAQDLVDASDAFWEIHPLHDCQTEYVHHYENGAYQHTTLTFFPADGNAVTFVVPSIQRASGILGRLGMKQRELEQAVMDIDAFAAAAIDPFHDVRGTPHWRENESPEPPGSGPVAGELPLFLDNPIPLAAVAAVLATGATLL